MRANIFQGDGGNSLNNLISTFNNAVLMFFLHFYILSSNPQLSSIHQMQTNQLVHLVWVEQIHFSTNNLSLTKKFKTDHKIRLNSPNPFPSEAPPSNIYVHLLLNACYTLYTLYFLYEPVKMG